MNQAQKNESFKDLTERLRGTLNNASVGPLRVSLEVVHIADNWEKYRGEAGDIDVSAWIKMIHPEHKLSWYRERARAVTILGKPIAFCLHHSACVRVARQVPPQYYEALKLSLRRLYRTNGDMYVTVSQASKAARAVMKAVEKEKRVRGVCAACQELTARIGRLEAQIKGLGATPVE